MRKQDLENDSTSNKGPDDSIMCTVQYRPTDYTVERNSDRALKFTCFRYQLAKNKNEKKREKNNFRSSVMICHVIFHTNTLNSTREKIFLKT